MEENQRLWQLACRQARKIVDDHRKLLPKGVKLYAKGGSPGDPPPVPPPPLDSEARAGAGRRTREVRNRQGFESTILTSGSGSADENVIRKSLLGG